MEIHVSTPEEKAAFKAKTQEPVLKFIREQVGDELVDNLIAAVDEARSDNYGK
jgi:C4-dicarboxylate-binding protein DctP